MPSVNYSWERAMWRKSYSKTVKGLQAEQVWKVWTDINQWHSWQGDIDYAKLEGDFKVGNSFLLKPKGGPKVRIELIRVEPNKVFTDLTRFPLARMYGSHEFIHHGDELEIKTTMSIEGGLAWLWRKIVAEDVANGMSEQTERLIEKARNG
jgi:uncharacterized protein YndB with AHSA1/START domain